MALSYLIKVNGHTIPKLTDYKLQRSKLWSEGVRNMAGDLRASFIGVFVKITLSIGYTTEDEITTLISIFDTPTLNVEWYDPKTKTYKTGQYYASDFDVSILSKEKELYKPFQVNLIPFKKLT